MKVNKKILNVIPYDKMRYPSAGDYHMVKIPVDFNYISKFEDVEQIDIADLGDEKLELLVFLHEAIESILTREVGIDEQIIMDFDLAFEEERELGLHSDTAEPGMDPRSPYREQHIIAEKCERAVAKLLKINWKEYEKKINELE
jgi:hypothetical protein